MYFFSLLGLLPLRGLFSLVAASRGYSLVAVHRLLTLRLLLIAEHGLSGEA